MNTRKRQPSLDEIKEEFHKLVKSPVNQFTFTPRFWEVNPLIYRILLVNQARIVMMATWGLMVNSALTFAKRCEGDTSPTSTSYRMLSSKRGIVRYIPKGMLNEFLHWILFLFLYFVNAAWWLYIVNMYLILIQRYNRVRLLRSLARMYARKR